MVLVPIDRWFGDKWLGFQGKKLGAYGVRSKIGRAQRLKPPAFHPNRVGECGAFERAGEEWTPSDAPAIHGYRSGEANTRLRLVDAVGQSTLVCWWSGVPELETTRAALMLYWVGEDSDDAVWLELAERGGTLAVRRLVAEGQGVLGALVAPVLAEHPEG